MAAHAVISPLNRSRTIEFSPFFRPETRLTTNLQELCAAVCVDVAGDNGTPCAVGITVETDAGGCWSGHANLACPSKDPGHDDTRVTWQEQVFNELARLNDNMRQSMSTTWKEHTIKDIIRLSVRISYSIPQEFPPVGRRVRGRCS